MDKNRLDEIRANSEKACQHCDGEGVIDGHWEMKECKVCLGSGLSGCSDDVVKELLAEIDSLKAKTKRIHIDSVSLLPSHTVFVRWESTMTGPGFSTFETRVPVAVVKLNDVIKAINEA